MAASGLTWGSVGGSSGVEFLKLTGSARPLALGGAYTGLADDSSAMFYNPAGLAQMYFPEIATTYNKWFVDTIQQTAAVVYPTRFGILGVGYSSFGSGDIQGYGASGEVTSVFNTSSSLISLSLGRRINPNLSLGVGIKSISEKLENSQAAGVALDAGLHYRVNPQITVGFSAMNFGSGLKFITENTPFPTSYRLGGAYSAAAFDDDVTLAADLISDPDGTHMNFGAEYLARNLLALRAGSSNGILRAGVGLYVNLFAIDYAYLGNADLGAAHRVTVSLLFGAAEETKKLVLEEMAYGKAFLKEGKYAEAVLKFEKVVGLDPKNEEAGLYLKKAQTELESKILEKVFAEKEIEIKRGAAEIIASGKQFLDQGKYIEALAEFGSALKLDPTNSEALKLQSQAQFKMETQLIEKSRTEAKEFLGEAMKLIITGKYMEALDPLNKALEKDPKNKQALELKKKLELIQKIQKR